MELEQLGQRFREVYGDDGVAKDGRRYSEISDAEIGALFIRSRGGLKEAQEELGSGGVADPELEQKKDALDQKISLLEKMWFSNEDKFAVSPGAGKIERLQGRARGLLESDEDLNIYLRYLKTLGPTLAKAAGDTGNIAWEEQKVQLDALAEGGTTAKEALALFKLIRAGFDLETKDDSYYSQLREGVEPKSIKGVDDEAVLTAPTDQVVTPGVKAGPMTLDPRQQRPAGGDIDVQGIAEQATEAASPIPQNILESLAGIQEFVGKTPALPIAGGVLGSAVGGPLGSAGGVIAGRQLQRGARERGEGESFLGALTQDPLDPEERAESVEDIKAAALAALFDKFFRSGGIKGNLTNLRGGLAARSGAQIPGETIAQSAVEAASRAPASVAKPAQRTALQAIEKFGDDVLSLPQALAERTASSKVSRSLAKGTVKAGGANLVEEAIRGALRSQIRLASPTIGTIDDILSKVFGAQRGAGKFVNPAASAVGTGAVFEFLRRTGAFGGR